MIFWKLEKVGKLGAEVVHPFLHSLLILER